MKVFLSLPNALPPPPTAALADGSAEVGKEKPQVRRTLLTPTFFPGGLAQPVPLVKLGLITGRPDVALPCAALLQLSWLTVPLGAGAGTSLG